MTAREGVSQDTPNSPCTVAPQIPDPTRFPSELQWSRLKRVDVTVLTRL